MKERPTLTAVVRMGYYSLQSRSLPLRYVGVLKPMLGCDAALREHRGVRNAMRCDGWMDGRGLRETAADTAMRVIDGTAGLGDVLAGRARAHPVGRDRMMPEPPGHYIQGDVRR